MIPPEVSTFSFHTALFVSLAGCAELRYKPPMRSERDKPYCFLSLVAAQNPFYGCLKLSYRTRWNTPPNHKNARSCASKNACCVACK